MQLPQPRQPEDKWQSISIPGDVQSRLLGKGICGLAGPECHKHQGNGHQQLSHQRQPVTPRAQHALQEQAVPLLPV